MYYISSLTCLKQSDFDSRKVSSKTFSGSGPNLHRFGFLNLSLNHWEALSWENVLKNVLHQVFLKREQQNSCGKS